MAKKKKAKTKSKSPKPRSFSGVIRARSREVQAIALAIRDVLYEELSDAEETFYGGPRPMGMYRTTADICFVQPQLRWCNIYFMRGPELTDPDGLLEGSSNRYKHLKVHTLEDIELLPIRDWLQESIALNEVAVDGGLSFDEVLGKLQTICLALPNTKETITWGKPHFRVGEKIFCGCAEDKGGPIVGLKMEREHSEVMMQLPGICKAPYSRPGDGWVCINPQEFDDWNEIEQLVVGSYRIIAPKRTVALLDGEPEKPTKKAAKKKGVKKKRKP